VAQGLPVEPPCFKVDPRYLSWIGGSIIPKLDSSKDMYVSRERYLAPYQNYQEHFDFVRAEGIA